MLKLISRLPFAALAFGAFACAKDEASAPPASPPELEQYEFFVGSWKCSGTTYAGTEHATEATVRVARAVGDRWFQLSYDEKQTAVNPTPYHVGVYWGYDSARKTFVQSCHDSVGGYCLQTSAGWNGDAMVFEGTIQGMPETGNSRDTFTKNGANELTHVGEMQGADRKWIRLDEETCRKGK